MSQRRNTPAPSSRRRHTGALVLAVAGLAACSTDRETAPTAPVAAAPAPAFDKGPDDKDAGKRFTDDALTSLSNTWHTGSADAVAATTKPLALSCVAGYQGTFTVSQRVGRNGTTIKFGKSEFKVPSGALSSDVQITATFTLDGQGVNVDFQPHGLKFAKAAEARIDFTGCQAPSGAPINAYYTNDQGFVTQVMPSSAASGSKQVRMLTDHFSGYTVSWGRR